MSKKTPRPNKKVLIEKTPCGRCPAMAEIEVTLEELVAAQKHPEKEPPPILQVRFQGQELELVSYRYLCSACQEIVSRNIRTLCEVEKRSALRVRGKKEKQAK